MKVLIILVALAGILIGFQNCGELVGADRLAEATADLESNSCEDFAECYQSEELIWLVIREYSPLRLDISSLDDGHVFVGGVCGTGTYVNHRFVWRLRRGFGEQITVGQGFSDNLCDNGRFSLPVVPNVEPVEPDRLYILDVELLGVDENAVTFGNSMPSNRGTLDIIFESN